MLCQWHTCCCCVSCSTCPCVSHGGACGRVESLFFGGMKGEIWVQPGKPASQVLSSLFP